MKLNGFVGKGSGKLGASVFAISGGEQIVRQYNPQVANPNTDAQVAQRAKLKLMSQLAAALAPGIAFKKQGLVSARNQFVSANIGETQFVNGKATVQMLNLKLTSGAHTFPQVGAVVGQNNEVTIKLDAGASSDINSVVYVLGAFDDNEQFRLVDVAIVSTPGANRDFQTTMTAAGDKAIVYAYGLIGSESKSGVKYGDYDLSMNQNLANLSTIENVIKSAAAYTQTVASATDL